MTVDKALAKAAAAALKSVIGGTTKEVKKWTPNAYMLYLNKVRPALKSSGMDLTSATKKAAEMWKVESAAEKARLQDQAEKLKMEAPMIPKEKRMVVPEAQVDKVRRLARRSSAPTSP